MIYRVYTKEGVVSKVKKKFISHLTRAQLAPRPRSKHEKRTPVSA